MTTSAHEPVIEARDVQLSFGQTPALRGASIAVDAARSWR